MINLSKPNAIVYITPNSVVVAGRKLAPARVALAEELVKNLEVKNPEKLVACCHRFFTEQGLKGKRIIVVLDPRITFTKTIPLDKYGNPTALTDAFIAAMPFVAGQRACIPVRSSDQLRLYATNADLYRAAVEGIRLVGHTKILAVTPSVAYDLSGTEKSFSAAVAVFLKDSSVDKTINFLEATVY